MRSSTRWRPSLLSAIPSLGWTDDLLRLAVAAGLGGLIGFERELRDREAGFRTHILVCLGSALFTIVSAYGFREFLTSGDAVVRADPTRIAAQIVTGIGFLGAGAIIRQGLSVRGLTTAATLWVAAAIGLASGAGYYSGAVIATVVTLLALWPFRILAFRIVERLRPEEQRLLVELAPETSVSTLIAALEREDANVQTIDVDEELDRRVVTLTLDTPSQRLVAAVSDLDIVKGVRWRR
jgi:putative Mg2+ transporter-C (MgtC) family protein